MASRKSADGLYTLRLRELEDELYSSDEDDDDDEDWDEGFDADELGLDPEEDIDAAIQFQHRNDSKPTRIESVSRLAI